MTQSLGSWGRPKSSHPRAQIWSWPWSAVLCSGKVTFKTEVGWGQCFFLQTVGERSACKSSPTYQAQMELKECPEGKDHDLIYLIFLGSIVFSSPQAQQGKRAATTNIQGIKYQFYLKIIKLIHTHTLPHLTPPPGPGWGRGVGGGNESSDY